MPLQGTFDILDFTEVLQLVSSHQLTGRLHVRHRSFGANLFLEAGLLTGADQSEHQTAANSGDVLGRIEEICFEMLDAERGSFEFQPGKPSALPATSRHPVDTVLDQARKRLTQWRELQELIPSLDLQPRLVGDLDRPEVTIDKERWRVLTTVDGRRNLRAIGRIVNLSDFDVCRVVAGLLTDGVVELDGLAALSAGNRDAIPTVPALAPPEPGSAGAAVARTRPLVELGARAGTAPPAGGDEVPGPDGMATVAADVATTEAPAPRATTSSAEAAVGSGDVAGGDGRAPVSSPSDVGTGGSQEGAEDPAGRRPRLVRIRSRQPGRDAG